MAYVNENYLNLQGSYLFANIARKVSDYSEKHPDADIIRLGIGDVTLPLVPAVIQAMHKAIDEMANADTFRGYGPEQGYEFLRQAIVNGDYAPLGLDISIDEIFVSDGAKTDVGNIQELFSEDNIIAITDPVYPVYLDSNVMAGRTGKAVDGIFENVVYLPTHAENNFSPDFPTSHVDIVYLCSPNNPTGTVLSRQRLAEWIAYCKENDTILMFDSAYEAFISTEDTVKSIYEIPGAKDVAIEFRSFSKTAGFTGTRCAYAVVPKEVTARTKDGKRQALQPLWNRRQCTKFNGVPYIIQRGAEAVYTPEGQKQTRANIAYYKENARIIKEGLESIGLTVYGGVDAPYIWLKTPGTMTSWELFDVLLEKVHIVSTPGSGFGPCGEGYLRLTAFGSRENTVRAVERIKTLRF
ncbi:L,L-diaminopimelate aminotransferase [Veillonella montpellierensis DNF00314]|uniref:LL-diaminopimelate aminotransferase n=1 Tax=Veillonella montpellierensis DNF00314 TaxID=1401067 RepID=A0A096AJ71_9FIRM|nr:LL-diaminopimelate aminotransferase [Veillonella montpellierensis]KGF46860.1 L,L-diaminopimelate aminotransferase [Veillonella montpellierensis DNF00314]